MVTATTENNSPMNNETRSDRNATINTTWRRDSPRSAKRTKKEKSRNQLISTKEVPNEPGLHHQKMCNGMNETQRHGKTTMSFTTSAI